MAGDYTFYQIPNPSFSTGYISYATCPRCGKYKWVYGLANDYEMCHCPPEPDPEPPKQYAEGWVCPVCGRGNAPWARECTCYILRQRVTSSNTTTWKE